MSQSKDKVIKIAEASRILGVHKDTIRRWEKSGKLKTERSRKGTRLFNLAELEEFKSQIQSQPSFEQTTVKKQPVIISQAAQILGVHKDTLRRWEKSGKISAARSVRGARLYDNSQLQKIELKPRIKPPVSTESLLQATQFTSKESLSDTTQATSGVGFDSPEVSDYQNVSEYHKDIHRSLKLLAGFTAFILTISFGIAAFITFSPEFQTPVEKVVIQEGQVLAASAFKPVIKINADTLIKGMLNVNGLTHEMYEPTKGFGFEGNDAELRVAADVTLDQDLSTTSIPTFAGLNVTSPINTPSLSTNKLVFDVSGQTGTLSWTPTADRTITLPDTTTTLVGTNNTQALTNKTISGSSNTLSNIANSALTNSKVTVSAGTNLTGGGDISLGSSVTLSLKDSISLSGTLAVSGTTSLNAVTYTWPSSQGSSDTVLSNNGSGTLSWGTLSSAAGWTDDGTIIRLTIATDNVGIGTSVPGSKLGIAGNVGIGTSYSTYPAPANGMIVEGNVGVGSTNADYNLKVAGSGYFTGFVGIGSSASISGNVGIGTSLTVASLANLGGLSVSGTSVLGTAYGSTLTVSGNTGIGSSLTTTGLDFASGGLRVNGFSDLTGNVGVGGTAVFNSLIRGLSGLSVSGNVGIGFSSPSSQLTVGSSGQFQINASGNITKVNNIPYSFPSTQGAANTVLVNDASGNLNWTTIAGVEGVTGTGFSGAIPYFNSASSVVATPNFYWDSSNSRLGIGTSSPGGSLVVASGNVGIGTTTPDYPLHVIGNVGIGTSLTVSSLANLGGLNVSGTSVLGTGYAGTLTVSGNTGIGSSLTTTGLNFASGGLRVNGFSDLTGNVGIGTSLNVSSASVLSTLRVNGISDLSGNVGIGSSAIINGLTTSLGGIRVNGLSDLSGNVGIGISLTVTSLANVGALNVSGTSVLGTAYGSTLTVSGNTGIGSSLTTTGLDFASGGLRVNGFSDLTGNVGVGGTAVFNSLIRGLSGLSVSGNVGVGTTSPSAKLDVSGTVNVTGATVIAPSTDGTTTSLTVRAANGSSGNILNITNTSGSSSYLSISSDGSLTVNGSTLTNAGLLESSGAIHLTGSTNTVVGTAIEGGWTMNSNTFTYRRQMTVTNNDGSNALPSNYEVTVTISGSNASQIYSNTQSDGDDFRVSYNSSEIKRNITTYTSSSIVFTFQLQSSIAASGSDSSYYIYYKNSSLSCSSCTYTGNVTLDDMDSAASWSSSDSTQFPIAVSSIGGNTGIGVTATVDNIGTFSTTSQGQLSTARTNFGFDSPTLSSTRYLYVVGGSTDGTAGNAQTTVLRTSVASATGHVGSWTTNSNSLSTALMDNTIALYVPPTSVGGTGADGSIDLANGGGAGGCTGTGLSWSGSTCTIATATKSTFNFTTVNVPSGTILTTDGPSTGSNFITIKATGNVGIGGTINLAGKGYRGGSGDVGKGSGGGGYGSYSNPYRGGGGGGGYGGGGGSGGGGSGTGGSAGSTYSTDDSGSGGGDGWSASGDGGHGGGGIEIDSNGTVTISGLIDANGNNVTQTSIYGQPGGGSGGRILIKANTITIQSGTTLTAKGGYGGTSTGVNGGGGGGGGGGRITLHSGNISNSGTVTVSGGAAGTGGASPTATAGSDGVSEQTSDNLYLYVFGGKNSTGTAQSAIYYATVTTTDGSIGSFSTSATSLPQALFGHTSTKVTISSTDYIYVIGGNNGTSDQTTVYQTSFNADGTISAITSTGQTQLSTGISYHAIATGSISSTNYLWVIGGLNGTTAQTTVYKGTFDGSGNLTLTTTGQSSLPQGLYGHSTFFTTVGSTNYIYVIGGMTSGGTRQTTIYRATVDSSGNVGSFATLGQTQLTTATGNHASITFTDSSSNYYAYMIGGNTAGSSGLTTVSKATYSPIDQTTYNLSETISSVDLTNKNDLQWRVYSSRTGSYMNLQFYDATGGWQTCSFSVSSASTWETKTCDITGVSSANKDAVTQLRLAVSSSASSEWTTYFDNIQGLTNAATISNTATNGSAVLGSAHLTLNSQGAGALLLNFDNSGLAGTGGMILYNGTTTPLLVADSSGNLGIGIGSTAPVTTLQIGSSLALGGNELSFSSTTGNLGIGTTQPGSRLGVAGNAGIGVSFANAAISSNGLAVQGNVGIGTTTTNASLVVAGNVGIGWTGRNPVVPGLGLSVFGNVGIGTTTASYRLDVAGGARFACGNSTWNSGPVTTCSDVAEVYQSDSSAEPGDIIATSKVGSDSFEVSGGMVTRSTTPYQQDIIGVYSTSPGILIGGETILGDGANLSDNKIPVALSGRAPVKVSTENGPIEVGDYLTSSSIPGVAMKATRPGQVVGKALENFAGNTGKILAFINVSYADPDNFFASLSVDPDGNLIVPKIKAGKLTLDPSVATAAAQLAINNEQLTINSDPNYTDPGPQLTSNSNTYDLADKIASLETRIAALEATASSDLADSTLDLTPPDILLASSSAQLTDLKASEATISGMLASYDLTVSNIFKSLGETTLGKTTIAGNLTVDGTLSIENGSEINALPILYLQKSPLSSLLDIFNGKVIIDKNGKITSAKIQTDKLILSSQVLGESKILTGTAETKIETSALTEKSKVFITPQTETDTPLFVIDKIIGQSFKVKTKNPAIEDIVFDWTIIDSP